jgi:hypothetical protein
MNWKGCGRQSVAKYYSHICLEGLRKAMKNLSQDSPCLDRVNNSEDHNIYFPTNQFTTNLLSTSRSSKHCLYKRCTNKWFVSFALATIPIHCNISGLITLTTPGEEYKLLEPLCWIWSSHRGDNEEHFFSGS